MNHSVLPRHQHQRFQAILGLLACLGLGAPQSFAQSASTAASSAPSADQPVRRDQEIIQLSPFEVNAGNDSGYVTNQSLSGSRFSQNLYDTPASISVITAEMMKDMGAYNLQEAMAWSVNSIASGVGDTSSSDATGFSDAERRNITVVIRGIQTTVARNFFKWSINSDAYNIERIDTSRGPNALLAGASTLAGLSNITTKQALLFKNQTKLGTEIQSVGGLRGTIDANRVLIKGKLALRLNAFKEDIDTWRNYGNVKNQAVSLAGTWKVNDSLTVRFEGERGNSESVLPKTAIRDFTNSWDHFTLATSTVGTAAQKTAANNAAGVAAEVATAYYVDIFRPDLGAVNWGGKVTTTGDGAYMKPFLTAGLSTGITRTPAALDAPTTVVSSAANSFLSGLVFPNWKYGNLLMAASVVEHYEAYSLFVEKKFSDNFYAEVAYNHQHEFRQWYSQDGNVNTILYDLSPTLPTGLLINGSNANPNYLKPFISATANSRPTETTSDEIRALATYRLKRRWFEIDFGGSLSYRESNSSSQLKNFTITNGAADLTAAANHPSFRQYLSDSVPAYTQFREGVVYTMGGSTYEYVRSGLDGSGSDTNTVDKLLSTMLYSFGSWGRQGKLKTTMGIRRDQFDVVTRNAFVGDPVTHRLVRYDVNGTTNGSINSPSLGAVYNITGWLAAYTNYSKSYVFSDKRQLSFLGDNIPPPIGTAKEYGIRFRVGNKVTGSIGYYDSLQVNNPINVNNLTASVGRIYTALNLGSFGQRGDTQTTTSTGYELQVTGNPTKSWTFTAGLGFPQTTGTKSYGYSLDGFLATEGPRFLQLAASDPAALAIVQTELAAENRIVANGRASDGQLNIRVPKMNGSFLTRYTFSGGSLKGLALGGGVRYVGENTVNYSATGNDITVDDYYESTLFAHYGFKWKNLAWKISLNVNNPFNDLNFRYTTINATTLDGLSYRITAPRSARLGIELAF